MDVKEAVALAKDHIATLFSQEGIDHLGLEEVEFDVAHDQWHITVGFSRPWDLQWGITSLAPGRMRRTYKIVVIDQSGKLVSVKNRGIADAT
jgi:hypothetical protein